MLILFHNGVNGAFILGSSVTAISLSVAYRDFIVKGEFYALQSVGVSPRRIGRSLLVVTSVIALTGVFLSLAAQRPIGTEYIGRVFGAAQFPLLADVSLPLLAWFRNQE